MQVAGQNPIPPDPTGADQPDGTTLARTRITDRMVRTTLSQVLRENHGGSWLVRSEREALTAPRKSLGTSPAGMMTVRLSIGTPLPPSRTTAPIALLRSFRR